MYALTCGGTELKTDPGGLEVERSLGVRNVAGSISCRDIPKVVKIWYKQLHAYARH